MSDNLNHNKYISCPKCLTLFKPRQELNSQYICICCGEKFDKTASSNNKGHAERSYTDSNNNTQFAANLRYQARLDNNIKDNLPVLIKKNNKSSTEKYIRSYKLKSRLLLLTWLFIPIIIFTMIVTTIFEYKNNIAQDYKWREYIVKFCSIFNCKVPSFSNLDYIIIEDNAIVANPQSNNKIKIFAILNNTGKFNQKFPKVNINFTDINGKIIKKNSIEPKNYLEDYKNNNKLLPYSKQYISILLDNPGAQATSYEINLG